MPFDNANEYLSPGALILLGADRLLAGSENWLRKKLYDTERTTFCVLGAMDASREKLGFEFCSAEGEEAVRRLRLSLEERGYSGAIHEFNDAPETTFSDIKALLQEAIELESAKVAA